MRFFSRAGSALAFAALLSFPLSVGAQMQAPKKMEELAPDDSPNPAGDDGNSVNPSTSDDAPTPRRIRNGKQRQEAPPEDNDAELPPLSPLPRPRGATRALKVVTPAAPAPIPAPALRPGPKPLQNSPATDADLYSAWERWRKASSDLDSKPADAAQADLIRLKDDLAISDLETFSMGFIRAAEARRQLNDPAGAVALATTAVALAPDLPYAHLALANAYFRHDPLNVGRILEQVRLAVVQTWEDPMYFRPAAADFASALLFAITATAIAAVLTLFLRRARYAFHDLHHFFPRPAALWQSSALALLVLILPIVLHLGVAATLLCLFAAVAFYLTPAERAVAVILIALLGFVAPAAGFLVNHTSFAGTVAEDVYQLEHGGLGAAEAAGRARKRTADGKAEYADLFALARYEMRRGQLDLAVDHFKLAAGQRSNDPRLLTNLGNAMLARSDPDGALETYKTATELTPRLPETFFNLGKLYTRRAATLPEDAVGIELDRAHVALSTAQHLDETLLTRPDPPEDNLLANRQLLSPGLSFREISDLAVAPEVAAKVEAQLSLALVGPAAAPWAWFYPGLVAAGLWAIGFLSLRARASRACEKCGRAVCRRCDPDLGVMSQLCGQCVNVYAKKSVVPAAVRVRKQLEVEHYRDRRDKLSYLFGLLCSGAGHLFAGLPVRGALYAFAFLFALFQIFFRQGVLRAPYGALPDAARWVPLCVLFLSVYLLSLRGLYKRQSR